MVQDVKTRWNSTCAMLVRAYRLRKAITQYCEQYYEYDKTHQRVLEKLTLSEEEWDHIAYLIEISKPFAIFGDRLCRASAPTLQHSFVTYDRLFNHIERYEAKLRRKRVSWKKSLLKGLAAAKEKLQIYYKKSEDGPATLYNFATILNPRVKTTFYDGDSWESHWKPYYEKQFREYFLKNYSNYTIQPSRPLEISQQIQSSYTVDDLLYPTTISVPGSIEIEVDTYLRERKSNPL